MLPGRFVGAFVISLLLPLSASLDSQSNATLQGRVFDSSGAVLPGATIRVRSDETSFDRSVPTDAEGRYYIDAIPPGSYQVSASAAGFREELIEELVVEVGRALLHDFSLDLGDRSETVLVQAEIPLVDRVSSIVGHVISQRTVH